MNHGSGSGTIKYWGISDRDGNTAIDAYKTSYGITNPCAGTAGNGNAIINTQYAGSFSFSGFPTYSVVCPNHTIYWDKNWSPTTATGFDSFFAQCSSSNVNFNPETTKFTTIFPNPAVDYVTVDFFLEKTALLTLEVYNIEGQKVYSSTVNNVTPGFNFTTLRLDNFSNGIYVIKLLQDQEIMDVRMLSVAK